MQIRTRVKDGVTVVEVIDASDGAVTHTCQVNEGQQCVVTATTAHSPADIEFGDVEAIPVEDAPTEGGAEVPSDGGVTEPPTTSAASEKPLYLVSADAELPEGFEVSGLETPDGATLYHYGSDTPGEAATGNVDGVSIYADADDDEQPVVAAPTEGVEQPGNTAEGAEDPTA